MTYCKSRIMNIIFKDSVKIPEEPVFRSIISAIAQVHSTNESSNLTIIPCSLGVKKNTLLVMRKKGPHNLDYSISSILGKGTSLYQNKNIYTFRL